MQPKHKQKTCASLAQNEAESSKELHGLIRTQATSSFVSRVDLSFLFHQNNNNDWKQVPVSLGQVCEGQET